MLVCLTAPNISGLFPPERSRPRAKRQGRNLPCNASDFARTFPAITGWFLEKLLISFQDLLGSLEPSLTSPGRETQPCLQSIMQIRHFPMQRATRKHFIFLCQPHVSAKAGAAHESPWCKCSCKERPSVCSFTHTHAEGCMKHNMRCLPIVWHCRSQLQTPLPLLCLIGCQVQGSMCACIIWMTSDFNLAHFILCWKIQVPGENPSLSRTILVAGFWRNQASTSCSVPQTTKLQPAPAAP